MALKREAKHAIVVKMEEIAKMALDVVTVEHRYLTVADLTALRVKAREQHIDIRVVRNTLAELALKDTIFACLCPVLKGPLLFAFSLKDLGSAARLLRDFAKLHEKLVIRNLAVEGQLLEAQALNNIANLPTRSEALSRLVAVLQAPLQQMLRVLLGPPTKLSRTLLALQDRKQAMA